MDEMIYNYTDYQLKAQMNIKKRRKAKRALELKKRRRKWRAKCILFIILVTINVALCLAVCAFVVISIRKIIYGNSSTEKCMHGLYFAAFTYDDSEKYLNAQNDNITESDNDKTNNFILDETCINNLPEKLQELYYKNPDAKDFVLSYESDRNKEFDIDLSEYEYCLSVPLLMQWDKRWGYKDYADGLFGLTGCGPTVLSMAAIYLTGNSSFTPDYIRQFSMNKGYSVDGSGSSWTLISEGARQLGLTVMELPLSKNSMINALEDGKLIVAIMGPGDFTDSGHFVLITGYDEGFIINDPNSYINSSKTWDYDDISGQVKNLWSLS